MIELLQRGATCAVTREDYEIFEQWPHRVTQLMARVDRSDAELMFALTDDRSHGSQTETEKNRSHRL